MYFGTSLGEHRQSRCTLEPYWRNRGSLEVLGNLTRGTQVVKKYFKILLEEHRQSYIHYKWTQILLYCICISVLSRLFKLFLTEQEHLFYCKIIPSSLVRHRPYKIFIIKWNLIRIGVEYAVQPSLDLAQIYQIRSQNILFLEWIAPNRCNKCFQNNAHVLENTFLGSKVQFNCSCPPFPHFKTIEIYNLLFLRCN